MNDTMTLDLILIVLTIVFLIGVYWLWRRYISSSSSPFDKIVYEKCQKEDIVKWFKDEKRIELLKTRSSLLAVVLKYPNSLASGLDDNEIMLCIFDEENSEILDAVIFHCETISNEIVDMFESKDMIVLS